MVLEIFANLGYIILLINTVIFLMGFSKWGKAYKIFAFYLFVMFLIQITVGTLQYMRIDNLFLSHFYFILQFILLSFFYLNLGLNGVQKKIIQLGFVFCLLTLSVQYALDFSLFLKFNLFEIFITSFLIILYGTFQLYNLLNEKKEFYYINLGILIYLFGSTVLFLVGNLATKMATEFNDIPWILNALLYVVYQIFILYEWKKSFSGTKKLSYGQ
ncbi:hypothetical protein NAT51_16800 [Flavobacterium amniphilum]|uniref:hypothetical protein n=1 Tax=Flavobacterium amniphilum TaxID=1834035 RepID=UPI00202A63FF|nr:hypothetical protein [Flavobacterium amniphilum]MCL9807195.1 hypothetical protein [Flavobacterium amniphilum]